MLRQDKPRSRDTRKHLYMGTLDGRLVAIDAGTRRKRWDVKVVDYEKGYSLTLAPLIIRNKIIVGPAGVNWASVVSSRLTMPKPGRNSGGSRPFPSRASRATRPGREIPGCTAAHLHGSQARMTPS